jgi:hypothetical protein
MGSLCPALAAGPSYRQPGPPLTRHHLIILLVLLYAAGGAVCAWKIVEGTQASTNAIAQILERYSLKNEGAQTLAQFQKAHPLLGMFVASPIRHNLQLSTAAQSDQALFSDIPRLLRSVRKDSSGAAWASCLLLNLSLAFAVAVIALERRFTTRPVLFALTSVTVIFFFIGIIAPALVVWTAPSIPLEAGNLNFVVQYQVRGIAAIIWELLTAGHWIIGGFLFLFSIVTPLTKASLTFFVTASPSPERNFRIGQLLHTIGKWSMADVFVAAVILALYALKFQEATKSIPCLGLYYFIGYCLLSMMTTELLTHSDATSLQKRKQPARNLSRTAIAMLGALWLCFAVGSSLYTYQQYTLNTKEDVNPAGTPQKLDSRDLVLPVHKS